MVLPYGEKNYEYMYNRLDTIPACDRQTDRQTDGHIATYGTVRAMHTRRAAKIIERRNSTRTVGGKVDLLKRSTSAGRGLDRPLWSRACPIILVL